ncbi:hypothetical protein [Micromonospora haikouensis]|uniref:hypothetical protein n=1 Tax=Micromonospora haikouensis TaxID=686309 RepID=UPI003D8EC76E
MPRRSSEWTEKLTGAFVRTIACRSASSNGSAWQSRKSGPRKPIFSRSAACTAVVGPCPECTEIGSFRLLTSAISARNVGSWPGPRRFTPRCTRPPNGGFLPNHVAATRSMSAKSIGWVAGWPSRCPYE